MLKECRLSILLTFATDSSVMYRPQHQPVHCACFLKRVCSVSALRTSLPAMFIFCGFNPSDTCATQFWPSAHPYYWEPLIALDIHLPIKSSMLPIKEVLSENRGWGWMQRGAWLYYLICHWRWGVNKGHGLLLSDTRHGTQ